MRSLEIARENVTYRLEVQEIEVTKEEIQQVLGRAVLWDEVKHTPNSSRLDISGG